MREFSHSIERGIFAQGDQKVSESFTAEVWADTPEIA
jgi:hypothetical protein